jgi:hypothetical protein
MISQRTAQRRVKKGIEFLDGRYKTWRGRVNPERISMASGDYDGGVECGCVLAQIDYSVRRVYCGSYWDIFKRILDGDDAEAERLGFYSHDGSAYDALTEAWKKALA